MKKITSILLAILFALSAAGCGETGEALPAREEASFRTGQPSQQELIESLRGEPIQYTDQVFLHPIPYTKPGTELTDEEAAAIGESLLRDNWDIYKAQWIEEKSDYDPQQIIEQEGRLYGKAKYYDTPEEELDILTRVYSWDAVKFISQEGRWSSVMRDGVMYIRTENTQVPCPDLLLPLEIAVLSREEKRVVVRAHVERRVTSLWSNREKGDLVYELIEQDGYWVLKDHFGAPPTPEQVYQPKEVYSYPRRTREIQVQDDVFIHPIPYAKPGELLSEEEVIEMFQSLLEDGAVLMRDYYSGWNVSVNPEECRVEEGKNWYKLNYFQTAAEFEGAFASVFSRYFARRTAGQIVRYSRYREWDGKLYFTSDMQKDGIFHTFGCSEVEVVSQEMQKLVLDAFVSMRFSENADMTGEWFLRYNLVVEDGRWVIENFWGDERVH